jgi:hypothetical protein
LHKKLYILKEFLCKANLKEASQELEQVLSLSDTMRSMDDSGYLAAAPPMGGEFAGETTFIEPINVQQKSTGLLAPVPKPEGLSESRLDEIRAGATKLKKGARDTPEDPAVSRVQKLLEGHGYALPQYGADGVFGSETESAVIAFQNNNKANGVSATGEIGASSLIVLESPVAVPASAQTQAAQQPMSSGEVEISEREAARQKSKGERAAKSGGGGGKVSASQLYNDLMAGLGNKNLCIAMVANAIAESALYPNINGDCGDYGKKKKGLDTSLYPNVFKKPKKGRCCSFGLWQYNICGGLGVRLLKHYGVSKDSPDEDKFPIITDYKKQVDFMIMHVKQKTNVQSEQSVDKWVDWFVRKVERPAKPGRAVVKRQNIAAGLSNLA